jgi:glucose/arabinose dehydrogenase
LLLASVFSPASAQAQTFTAVPVGTFANPVYVEDAPGAPNLLFVVERAGRIMVLQNGVVQPVPFLDIRNLVLGPGDLNQLGEDGLFSMAFPPDYQTSGRFYVMYTLTNGALTIDEFRRSATNPLLANRNSRRRVLNIPHPLYSNHNGGQLQFGPDGLLYASVGDGGGTPAGQQARNKESLLGKILRINPLPSLLKAYTIPPTNPYVGIPGKDEIYAYGLRNPWRFSFDGSTLTIGDVGAGAIEEVNVLPLASARGANFGWPQYEGNQIKDPTRPGADPPTFPMHTYPHTGGACSVTGGYVVHDPGLPALAGRYLYGDYCTGQLRSFAPDVPAQQAIGDAALGINAPQLTSFGEGAGGQIYFTQLSGAVWQLEQAP